MSPSSSLAVAEGPGSVFAAPNLPPDFTNTFTSHYIDTGDVRLHAVIGGDGPPLLLIHGWRGRAHARNLILTARRRGLRVHVRVGERRHT